MVDNEALLEESGPTRPPQTQTAAAASIDFAKYRSGDLAQRLAELLSVPGAVRRIVKATVLLVVVAVLACWLLFASAEIGAAWWLLVLFYSLAIGLVFGLILGVVRVANGALSHLEAIVGIVLRTTAHVADDYQRIHSGAAQLPGGDELVEQVYGKVVAPAMERAVAGSLGVFGKPLLWIYRPTVGWAVHRLVRRVGRREVPAVEQQQQQQAQRQIVEQTTAAMGAVAAWSQSIEAFTTRASEVVATLGGRLRRGSMILLYGMFAAGLLLAIVPLVVVRALVGTD